MECGLLPDMLTEHHTHVIFTIMSPSVLPCIELQVDCVSVYAAQNTCMYVCMYAHTYMRTQETLSPPTSLICLCSGHTHTPVVPNCVCMSL